MRVFHDHWNTASLAATCVTCARSTAALYCDTLMRTVLLYSTVTCVSRSRHLRTTLRIIFKSCLSRNTTTENLFSLYILKHVNKGGFMNYSQTLSKITLTCYKCDVFVKGQRIYFLISIFLSSPTNRKLGSVNMTESQWEPEQTTPGHVPRKIVLEKSKVVTC